MPLLGGQPSLLGQRDKDHSLAVVLPVDQTPIPVTLASISAQTVTPLVVGFAGTVPASTLTTVATYSAIADKKITQVLCSGMEYGKFQLFINSILKMTRRGGPNRNVDFNFNVPLSLPAASVIDIKVTHFVPGETPDFEATILGF